MPNFHDVSFPLALAFGATGGPTRRTDITRLASGGEQRNSPHAHSRRRYNAGAGMKSLDDLHVLIAFFEARMGQLHAFRFRDPADHKSCLPSGEPSPTDQLIGTGNAANDEFQLIKSYSDISGSFDRLITKPVPNSAVLASNGTPVDVADYSLNLQTGRIIFNTPPVAGAVITAGYEFDVPVRFDTDQLELALEAFGAGEIVNVPLIEVLDYA